MTTSDAVARGHVTRGTGRPRVVVAITLLLLLLCIGTSGPPARADACPSALAGGSSCGDPGAGSHTSGTQRARFVANPVDVITGAKVERRIDWQAFGSRLAFERHYHSGRGETDRGLGGGWRHGLDLALMRLPGGAGLRLVQADGRSIDFAPSAGAERVWTSDRDGRMEIIARTYVWMVPDGRRITFPGPRPVRIDWPDGDRLELSWRDDRLTGITDRHGHRITLRWTPGPRPLLSDYEVVDETTLPGHLDTVTLPDGTRLRYRYDNRHRLRAVHRDGARGAVLDTERTDYKADTASLNALHDRSGTRRWDYADDGRVERFVALDGRTLTFTYRDLPAAADERRGRTVVQRADGMHVDHDWRIDRRDIGSLTRVIEYPCLDCNGGPRDITPARSAEPDPEPASVVVEGVRVERFDTAGATVYIESLDARFAVRFDHRARVRRIGPLDPRPDAPFDQRAREELTRTTRALDEALFVDGAGLVHRRKSATTDVCPLAIVHSCDELEHDLEMARLSMCSYEPGRCPFAGEWEQLDAGDFGLQADDMENRYIRAVPFRHGVTREIVIAFRGTANATDVATDLNQREGRHTLAYQYASDLGRALQARGHDVTYTGHSLGGGLATLAALIGERQAVGFNSASLTESTAARHGLDLVDANRYVTHLLVPGEAVTALQETPMRDPSGFGLDNDYDRVTPDWVTYPAPGRRDMLADPPQADIDQALENLPWLARAALPTSTEEAIARHLMIIVISSLDATIAARCGHLPPTP